MIGNVGKRGGRVSVTRLQFVELERRVEALEKASAETSTEKELTKPEIMESLKEKGIEFNPRDKKEALLSLLQEA